MRLKTCAVNNVASSWGGLAVNIAVGFFLSPFIEHNLGDRASSLWILIFSMTGYYGIFDSGIRCSHVSPWRLLICLQSRTGLQLQVIRYGCYP
jgi:hypothetical protein